MAALLLFAVSVDFGVPGQELLSTLRFHIGGALLLLPLGLALAGARLRALVMVGLVGLSLAQGAAIVLGQQQRRAPLENDAPQASFRALSFNILKDNRRRADAATFVVDSDADILVLMETSGLGATGLDAVAARYPYRLGCDTLAVCDVAIFSRTPLADTRILRLEGLNRRRLLTAATIIEGRPVTIVALHLTKPYFDNVAVFELHQARAVIGAIEGPVLLAGDFNAAAWSAQIAAFASDLALVPPSGYPATWPVEIAPLGVPIDNMFTRGPALIREIAPTPEAFGSNHMGLLATVDLF
ncbi:endonuclease/exonuclease/phosphatase family protein [Devosia ginsengisoli]|uniref:endonuclease/exonuclease/phosphatase family protein n=1 Tax=Devosia ginsengisoli TaxID=400770 RepID=UPI0026F238C7|nr:endonuclease/exonuclease/phosphatase family protein [Devosia ginsengisoli]MCR6673810.1 endonuclease/exonuclease/phosphatase family protein [Devosia ginsengisoli]